MAEKRTHPQVELARNAGKKIEAGHSQIQSGHQELADAEAKIAKESSDVRAALTDVTNKRAAAETALSALRTSETNLKTQQDELQGALSEAAAIKQKYGIRSSTAPVQAPMETRQAVQPPVGKMAPVKAPATRKDWLGRTVPA